MQRQIDRDVIAIQRRAFVEVFKDLGDRLAGLGILCQLLALVDDGTRDRVIEHALGQVHLRRRAFAGLAERISRHQPDLDRQPGPGMRRQIVIAGRLRLLEMQARQGQFELDRLLGVAARLGRIRAADHRLDALDAIIVAGLVIEAQRGARRALGRLGEGDGRRVVGDDLDRPIAEHRAALQYRQLLALGQRRLDPKILLVDWLEIARLAVDRQARHRVTAMHLSEQGAAGRDLHRFLVAGAQELRC
jgi:hypothetical protein